MSRTLCRLAVTAVSTAAVSMVALAPSPALAGSMFFSKSSGTTAFVEWLEIGPLPGGVAGNAHFGDLHVSDLGKGRVGAFGTVTDVQCDEGVTPYNPGGLHGEEPPADGPCQVVGLRFIDGGSLTFTMDRKFTAAKLTGTLAVQDHGTGGQAAPPVDISWAGTGPLRSERISGTSTDENGTFTYRMSFTGRDAVVQPGSKIGVMIFDDVDGEYSRSSLGSFRDAQRGRL